MIIMNRAKLLATSIVALMLSACGQGEVEESTTAAAKPDREAQVAGDKVVTKYDGTIGKPGAPFRVSYDVVGTPIVGSPVTVNLRVTSALGSSPVKVTYRINDASAMAFHEAQPASVEISPAANEDFVVQQVTVIPQREGRLYLNVATSVDTDEGSRSSVVAIPIQVGAGARTIEEQGEVEIDEDGEAVRVLSSD